MQIERPHLRHIPETDLQIINDHIQRIEAAALERLKAATKSSSLLKIQNERINVLRAVTSMQGDQKLIQSEDPNGMALGRSDLVVCGDIAKDNFPIILDNEGNPIDLEIKENRIITDPFGRIRPLDNKLRTIKVFALNPKEELDPQIARISQQIRLSGTKFTRLF